LTFGGTARDDAPNPSSGEEPDKAFDGNTASKWFAHSIAPTTAQAVTVIYTLTSANDSSNRNPKSGE
jgi:hypothetical protein